MAIRSLVFKFCKWLMALVGRGSLTMFGGITSPISWDRRQVGPMPPKPWQVTVTATMTWGSGESHEVATPWPTARVYKSTTPGPGDLLATLHLTRIDGNTTSPGTYSVDWTDVGLNKPVRVEVGAKFYSMPVDALDKP